MPMEPGRDLFKAFSLRRPADVVFVFFLLLFVSSILGNFLYTWDVVGYVGAALSWQTSDPLAIHTQTYELLRLELPEQAFAGLVGGPYATAMASNAEQFYSQLDMYRIKPLYVGLLNLLDAVGLSLVDAGKMLSVVPAGLLCILIYVWLKRHVSANFALSITVLLSLCSRLFDVARVILPDSLSALILVLAVYLLLERPAATRWAFSLLVLSILVRTNNILFVTPLLIYVGYAESRLRGWQSIEVRRSAIALVVAVICYFVVSASFNHQWWRLFHHTFIESIADMNAFAVSFSFDQYLQVLGTRLRQIVIGNFAMVTMLLPFLLFAMLGLLASRGRFAALRMIVAISFLNFVCYFLMFPLVESWDRFFIPFYIFIVVLVVKSVAAPSMADNNQVPISGA
ncbi:MAG: hypothetical protein Q7V56_09420 [Gammaproteobacteria bacterium]|nr:hypothetical protein [Gammaproteobacteria bacterium]